MFAMQKKLPVQGRNKTAIDRLNRPKEIMRNPVWAQGYFCDENKDAERKLDTPTNGRAVVQCKLEVNRNDLREAGLSESNPSAHNNEMREVKQYLGVLGPLLKKQSNNLPDPLSKDKIDAAVSAAIFALITTYSEKNKVWDYNNNPTLKQNDLFKPHLKRIPQYLFKESDAAHGDDIVNLSELFAMDAYVQSYGAVEDETLGLKGNAPVNLSDYHRSKIGSVDFEREKKNPAGGQLQNRFYDPLQTPEDAQLEGRYNKWLGEYEVHALGKGTGAVCVLDVSFASLPQLNLWLAAFGKEIERIKSVADSEPKSIHEDLIKLCNTYVVSYDSKSEAVRAQRISALKQLFDNARSYLREKFEASEQLEEWRAGQGETVDGLGELFE